MMTIAFQISGDFSPLSQMGALSGKVALSWPEQKLSAELIADVYGVPNGAFKVRVLYNTQATQAAQAKHKQHRHTWI
jgi:hypothetical protein